MRARKMRIACLLSLTLLFVLPNLGISPVNAADGELAPTSNMRTVGQFTPYTVIEDFESDASIAGWQAGENVSEVSLASSAWDVFFPYEGSRFLAIKSNPNLQNNVWRTASKTFDTPLDLSGSRYLMMAYNNFGYLPNDDPYYARLKVYSGDSSIEGIVRVYNNQWNKIGIDLSGWEGRGAIDKLEVGFIHDYDRADHPEDTLPNWPTAEFYIDYIHAANVLDWQFSYDGDSEGWRFSDSIASPTVAAGRLSFEVTGPDPMLTSAPIRLDAAENNVVTLKLRNGTASTSGRLYWTTEDDGQYDSAKMQAFDLKANDGGDSAYSIRLIGNPRWTGRITGLRLQLAEGDAGTGAVALDGIDFSKQDRPDYEYIGTVADVRADAQTVTVTGSIGEDAAIPADAQLQLYELAPYQYEPDVAGLTPAGTMQLQAGERTFSFQLDRFDGTRDRYFSKYSVAVHEQDGSGGEQFQFVDWPKSVTDVAFPAAHSFPYPEAQSKKGLNVQMTDDAEELGVSHATVTVVVNGLMYKDDVDPANAIAFEQGGQTYYFHKDAVEELDRHIKSLSDNGTLVYLVLILYDADDPNGSTNVLIHPDAARGQGTVYAFNTANEEGVRYFTAAIGFLADRYTQDDERYGRAMGYIVGNEVDSAWQWQNMGDKTVDQFMEQYERTVRLAYLAVRQYSDSARVYISLDNAWNEPYFSSDPTRYYKGKDIVDLMNTLSKQGGDFPWNVAYHSYPEDMLDPRTWNDHEHVTEDFDSPKITFKNLDVLDRYMGQEALKIHGERRRIILSEQGFQTQADTPEAEQVQAAGYAYAYYKARFLDGIDAFILFNQLDIPSAGLNMGLWTQDPSLAGFVAQDKKFIYDVFRDIDTDRSLEATAFAKPIIGISDWSEVIPNFDASRLSQRMPPQQVPISINKRAPKLVQGDGFEDGADGWTIADNAVSARQTASDAYQGSGSLQVDFAKLIQLTFVGLEKLWKGAEKTFDSPVDASETPNLNLAVKLTDPLVGQPYYVKVKAFSGTQVAEGVVQIDAAKGWNALSVDLSDWEGVGSIDRIKVWTRKTTSESWNGSLLIDEVGFSKKNEAVGGQANLEMAVTSDMTNVEAGAYFTVEVTNHDAKELSGEIAVEPIGNLSFDSSKLKLSKLGTGDGQRFRLRVASYDPQQGGAYGIRFRYRNTVQETLFRVGDSEEAANVETTSMAPFWQGDTVVNESVLMVDQGDGLPEGRFMYPPTEIVSVKNARLDTEYEEGVDWTFEDGAFRLTAQSRIPYMTEDEMVLPEYIPNESMPRLGGGAVLYREGSFFHDRQIVITYKHVGAWNGPVPKFDEASLPKTIGKLRAGAPVKLALYGDSISVGANASGYTGVPPYLPIWGRMTANALERYYHTDITFVNPSVGGTTSTWGKDHAAALVASEHPDLVIIAFGMNDGSGTGIGDGVRPSVFKENIRSIIDTVRAVNPAAEFILVGTTLPNPETFFLDQQPYYNAALNELASGMEGVAAANLTGVHAELLKTKSFGDMTGNNINHPNDFLSRWYAQFVFGMLADRPGRNAG
ncbi:DUF5722 domain-containing protein [Cohnella zeiphila]|uniref:SGNH/GDSL hydrolase family protein n=1 Tax=Cohnella zeiphila TaxID=2761120 RepID=A0A7X0VY70_9BACL|nr:DUF5722 domain-containing protein [Cohnella zeiphila]MBB6734380.1 SGNH/GDSL hydrolase family protein [Cohnella zeiphila]